MILCFKGGNFNIDRGFAELSAEFVTLMLAGALR